MSVERESITIPRPALVGAALLVALSIALAAIGSWSGRPAAPEPSGVPLVRDRAIRFATLPGDSIAVLDAGSEAIIVTYGPGEGGFVRGSLRALAWQRRVKGLTLEQEPFRLSAWDNGRLALDDPATGNHVELNAFGPDNVREFARLLR